MKMTNITVNFPANNICLLKANNGNTKKTKKICEKCSKSIITKLEKR